MRVALGSDLHLEFGDCFFSNEGADVLILSGDIMVANTLHDFPASSEDLSDPQAHNNASYRKLSARLYRNFLRRASLQFKHVIYVAGNHEFYCGNFFSSIDDLRNECSIYNNVHFLENDTIEINGVYFIGATLWTDCNKMDPHTLHGLGSLMTDFTVIRNDRKGFTKLKPADTVARHEESKRYIKHVIQNLRGRNLADLRVVFVGHHAPSHLSIHKIFINDRLMNGGFYSDMGEFILDHPEIVLWTHGHMHHPFDYMIGNTRVVCNPRGYVGYEPQTAQFKLQYLDI